MNTITPLEAQRPEIFAALLEASETRRLEGAVFACKAALASDAADDTFAQSILAKIEIRECLSEFEIKAIGSHAEKLDEKAGLMRQAFERDGKGSMQEYYLAFDRFLAVNAVAELAKDQGEKGVIAAVYSAVSVTSDNPSIRQCLLAILRGE